MLLYIARYEPIWKKTGLSTVHFRNFQDKPEIDSLAPIVSENAFSGVLGGRSGHFFIERRMQVLDRK